MERHPFPLELNRSPSGSCVGNHLEEARRSKQQPASALPLGPLINACDSCSMGTIASRYDLPFPAANDAGIRSGTSDACGARLSGFPLLLDPDQSGCYPYRNSLATPREDVDVPIQPSSSHCCQFLQRDRETRRATRAQLSQGETHACRIHGMPLSLFPSLTGGIIRPAFSMAHDVAGVQQGLYSAKSRSKVRMRAFCVLSRGPEAELPAKLNSASAAGA